MGARGRARRDRGGNRHGERGFGARLDAVRVHTDANAAAATRAIDARGFAAGRDVYLDLPQSELAGEGGFTLLAHEIAHVLQQTGRGGVGCLVHVTPILGTGAVQCSDDFAALVGPVFKAVIDRNDQVIGKDAGVDP